MYNKKPKAVDTKFVFSELNKIKQAISELDNSTDFLYASVLFEEAKEFVMACKTVSYEKVQKKFGIGYLRTAYVLQALEQGGYITSHQEDSGERTCAINKKSILV